MHKKLAGITLLILALAVAVLAPGASASPVLTNGGKAVPVGTQVTGKNLGTLKFTTPFLTECTAFDFTFWVTSNSGTKLRLEAPLGSSSFSGTGAGGDCTSSTGASNMAWNSKLCLEATSEDKIIATGCGAKSTFTTTITTGGFEVPCTYAATSFTGTFLTNADATLSFTSQIFQQEGAFCYGTTTQLDLAFELTTTAGGTLVIS